MTIQFNSEIFKKISKFEKKDLCAKLIAQKSSIFVKGEMDELFNLCAQEVLEPLSLVCTLHATSPRPRIHQDVILSFSCDEDRYFSNTKLLIEENRLILDMSEDVFLLQRRKSARIDLPEGMFQSADVILLKNLPVSAPCMIENFSVGGLKLRFEDCQYEFQTDMVFDIIFQISRKSPLKISCQVRHQSKKELNGTVIQYVGAQFLKVEKNIETRLMIMFMDLQREIFLKFFESE